MRCFSTSISWPLQNLQGYPFTISTGMCLQIYFHFNISLLREFQLFLVEFFDSVNKTSGELSHTLLYSQCLKATAKFPLFLYEGVNNNYTAHIQLAVYSCIPNVIFSYTRTCSNFSRNVRWFRRYS